MFEVNHVCGLEVAGFAQAHHIWRNVDEKEGNDLVVPASGRIMDCRPPVLRLVGEIRLKANLTGVSSVSRALMDSHVMKVACLLI